MLLRKNTPGLKPGEHFVRDPERIEKILQLMMGGMAMGSGACLLKFKNN